MLKNMSINVILKDLNTYINKMGGYYILKVIKKFLNRDFAVLTINNEEAKKL